MEFKRNLKKGMSGEDVRYMKECLYTLKYLKVKPSHNRFGSDTEKAVINYQKGNKDINNKKLSDDGIIGRLTWSAITRDIKSLDDKPSYTRILKKGMVGEDVRYMKECLYQLEYLKSKPTHNKFGGETEDAVMEYQLLNKDVNGKQLNRDGKIGKLTWGAIERDYLNDNKKPEMEDIDVNIDDLDTYKHISANKRRAIAEELENVSDLRKAIVMEILQYAYDKDVPGNVRALYLWGANLYNKDLTLNIATEKKIISGAAKDPQYFNGGRKEWMIEQIKRDPNLPASDCSGMEVGYLRKHKLVKSSFDATANTLSTSSKYSINVSKSDLKPGDWVARSGHIGTYVGGGWVVEFYGGAYGCQLTKLLKRQGYDFVAKKVKNGSAWTRFRRPVFY